MLRYILASSPALSKEQQSPNQSTSRRLLSAIEVHDDDDEYDARQHDDDDDDDENPISEVLVRSKDHHQMDNLVAQYDVKIGDGMDIAIHGENGNPQMHTRICTILVSPS